MSTRIIHPFLKGFLSQWHPSNFEIGGRAFNCGEQYMMYQKARLFGDDIMAGKIMSTREPSDHKRMGAQVRDFDHDVWEHNKVRIVYEGNLAKFTQNAGLQKKLLATGDALLVEANPRDSIWGAGLSERDPLIQDPSKWPGQNLLGEILMRVREELTTGR